VPSRVISTVSRLSIPSAARSWIEVSPESHFPIQNLPVGVAAIDYEDGTSEIFNCVPIGDVVVNIDMLSQEGLIPEFEGFPLAPWSVFGGQESLREVRRAVFELLEESNSKLRDHAGLREAAIHERANVVPLMPMKVSAFVDFYSGINHASNVGRMFRPDQPPLLPNYRHLPVAYNGRASSVVPSEHDITRPKGQFKVGDDLLFGATRELDFELEVGFFVANDSDMGDPIPIGDCEDYMLGMVLVNDWSARDIQRWEYQPLGPFLAKSFATSISPWIVSFDALEQFRIAGAEQEPPVLPHLQAPDKAHYDIQLEVAIQTAKMTTPQVICRSNTKHLYWSFVQQLAHQSSNGTPLEIGDLYGSGTISGETEDSFGSLLELTWRGTKPLTMLETGESRTFLEDGDTLIMTGWGQADGYRIGFGEVRTTIEPSPA
jgi:fumarylacetoacetase